MDTTKIKAIIIAILATFAALYLGITAATAQFETIAWVIGGLTLIVCLMLGRRIWLLLPFMSALAIQLRLPGQPDTLLIAEFLVLGFSALLLLMRKLPWRLEFTELEFWMLVLTLFVIQVYARNPVGLNVFGGSTVGGKAYVLFAIASVTALLLGGLRTSVAELRWVLPLTILGGLGNLLVSAVGRFVPIVGYYIGQDYISQSETNHQNMQTAVDEKAAGRIGFLSALGNNLSLWISSFISPLKACFRPFWAILILVTLLASMLGGFRNGIASMGLTLLLGIAYRSGLPGIILSLLGGTAGLLILAIVNSMYPLPPNIQRSLSFLPGTWEQRYVIDAEGSTDWRVEIWKEALLTERWITNKWLGDGLGFTAAELRAQSNLREGSRLGVSGFEAHREAVLANGDYHSGPVSTIRTIGYVGLIFFLIAQVRLAVHAHRQILRCKGTEWFPLALLVGIPLVWNPLFFVLIFGSFKGGVTTLLIGTGMVRLLENNLPLHEYVPRRRRTYVPVPTIREHERQEGLASSH